MKRWEYKEHYMNWGPTGFDVEENVIMEKPLKEQLNALGSEGWELVELRTSRLSQCGTGIFKREVT